MKHEKRRALAYIVGRIITGKEANAIFDYKNSQYFHFGGQVTSATINVFDYSRSSYLSGSPSSIYDYATGSYLSISLHQNGFDGFDYETSQHFSGSVNSNSINLYDYESASYFNFSL